MTFYVGFGQLCGYDKWFNSPGHPRADRTLCKEILTLNPLYDFGTVGEPCADLGQMLGCHFLCSSFVRVHVHVGNVVLSDLALLGH
jgi:hypothetical protein